MSQCGRAPPVAAPTARPDGRALCPVSSATVRTFCTMSFTRYPGRRAIERAPGPRGRRAGGRIARIIPDFPRERISRASSRRGWLTVQYLLLLHNGASTAVHTRGPCGCAAIERVRAATGPAMRAVRGLPLRGSKRGRTRRARFIVDRRAPSCTCRHAVCLPPPELVDVVPRGSTGARTRSRAVMSLSPWSSVVPKESPWSQRSRALARRRRAHRSRPAWTRSSSRRS